MPTAPRAQVPEAFLDLLQRPLFGFLATIRPDNTPQVNPVWYSWDGTYIKFTNTSKRQKYKNIQYNPHIALSITDPNDPYRYLEIRGIVEENIPDPTGSFWLELAQRYNPQHFSAPPHAQDRVIVVMRPLYVSANSNA